MNKDVIYIEPEDDITDVISRIKTSTQKIIALVPPKKLGIMRSAVNIKLIAKTAKSKDKAVVIITTDPSLIKLSAFSGLPVAKTLNSRPMLPSEFTKRKKQETEELAEKDLDMPAEDDTNVETIIDEKPKKKAKIDDEMALDSDEVEEDDKKNKDKKENKITEKIPNFDKYRKWIVVGGISAVVLIVALVWAFAIAPRSKIIVEMKTVASNISETVTLVTDENKKNNAEGKLLLEQLKYEEEKEIEVPATGKANKGEKAKGTLSVIAKFTSAGSAKVAAGSIFTNGGKKFTANEAASFEWNGSDISSCENKPLIDGYCRKSAKISVTASEGGTSYNIAAASSGWTSSVSGVSVLSSSAMTGGTDKEVTVVDEKDIDEAKSQLANHEESEESKKKLYEQIGGDVKEVESSYKVEVKDEKVSPKKGEEVKDGAKVKMTAKVVYTIYVVDRTAIEEYVKNFEKDKISEKDRIYSYGTPFFERFLEGKDGTYTAKLKTTIKVGPEVSESAILETAKGKKNGEVKALVKDMSSNIVDVKVNPNFPWVYAVPNDPNKVEVEIEVDKVESEEE